MLIGRGGMLGLEESSVGLRLDLRLDLGLRLDLDWGLRSGSVVVWNGSNLLLLLSVTFGSVGIEVLVVG